MLEEWSDGYELGRQRLPRWTFEESAIMEDGAQTGKEMSTECMARTLETI